MLARARRTLAEHDQQRGFVLGVLVAAFLAAVGSWWLGSPQRPTYAVVENDRSTTVILQLDDPNVPSGRRAWAVPPGGFGPAVEVDPGTAAFLYSVDCVLIQEIVIHSGFQGFVLRADGMIVEMQFGHITNDATTHPGCA